MLRIVHGPHRAIKTEYHGPTDTKHGGGYVYVLDNLTPLAVRVPRIHREGRTAVLDDATHRYVIDISKGNAICPVAADAIARYLIAVLASHVEDTIAPGVGDESAFIRDPMVDA
jgi:hypothetical protein